MSEQHYVRFDWAMKRLLRHKKDFVVVEGFLSSLLEEPVTIVEVLESESNRETATDKANRADVIVKDAEGRKILIEIQQEWQDDFFLRMLYGTSKLVTQYLSQGDTYSEIGKVYSVNIVYFSLGVGDDYVYRGTTVFRGIHTSNALKLTPYQRVLFPGREDVGDLYPEYFVLRVNDFDKVAATPLDEWIHFLKTEEIPAAFKAPGLDAAREVLHELRLTPAEREVYLSDCHHRRNERSSFNTAVARGLERGRAEGRAEGEAVGYNKGREDGHAEGEAKGPEEGRAEGHANGNKEGHEETIREMAAELSRDGMTHDRVAKITGLTMAEIAACAGRRK